MVNSSTQNFNEQNNWNFQTASYFVVIMFDDTFFNYTNIVFLQGKVSFSTGGTWCSGLCS